jgi:hypothetical protein
MSAETTPLALWDPGWYNLDQSLKVGRRDRFAFGYHLEPTSYDLIFANDLGTLWNYQRATVEVIEHAEFGLLDEVDTTAFGQYTFRLQDGRWVTIEAEQELGSVNAASADFPIDACDRVWASKWGWALVVLLSGVTSANRDFG